MRRGGRRLGGLIHMCIDKPNSAFKIWGRFCICDLSCKLDIERFQLKMNL